MVRLVRRAAPEAGSIKTDEARWVPIHEHLVAQGFLTFAQGRSDGPLFCAPTERAKSEDPAVVSKSRAAQVRQRLAAWVRGLSVAERAVRPNHGPERPAVAAAIEEWITGPLNVVAARTSGPRCRREVMRLNFSSTMDASAKRQSKVSRRVSLGRRFRDKLTAMLRRLPPEGMLTWLHRRSVLWPIRVPAALMSPNRPNSAPQEPQQAGEASVALSGRRTL